VDGKKLAVNPKRVSLLDGIFVLLLFPSLAENLEHGKTQKNGMRASGGMLMSRTMRWLVLTCGLLLMAAPVFAATQNAVMYGTVYDATGNPMAGATVILENPALGFTRTTTTGSDGSYNFAEVPPAEGYRLTAAKGEKKLDIHAGITVNVGDERVILPPLKEQAATAAAVVEKKAEASAVANETVSSTVSGVITGDQLRSLPLYNRNFLALGLLTPNTHDTEANSELLGASFSVSGNRPNQNNFLLDGSDNVASSSNQAVPYQVNDSVQEFRLISSNASAEYGRNAGGTVNVVTRRGGNGFHGSVFGYFGNDALNADNPLSVYNGSTFDQAAAYAGSLPGTAGVSAANFSPLRYNDYVAQAESLGFCTNSQSAFTGVAGSVPCVLGGTGGTGENTRFDPTAVLAANNRFKPSFDSKQFGVNAGGPLVKDKVFWFLSYEGTRINNPNPIFERVPTTFDKTYDPFATGSFNFPVTGGQQDYPLGACTSVTAACGSARGILSLFPNSNVVGVPGVLEFFRGQAPNFTHVHNGLARVDILKSAANSFTIRYVAQGLNQLHDDTLPVQPNYPGNGAFRGALNQNINATWSHTFSPTLINELRFGISRFNVSESAQDASFDATTLGLTPNNVPAASNFPNRALSTILLNGMDAQYSGATPGIDGAYCAQSEFFLVGPCQSPSLDYLFPFARLGAPLNVPSSRRDDTWTIADSVSWSHGKHAVKFGVEFRNLNNRSFDGAWQRGFVYSSDIGQFTSDSSLSCNQVCPSEGSSAFTFPTFDFAQSQTTPYAIRLHSVAFAGYIQDTWRISPRFTMNIGLRYQYLSVPKERNDQLWNFDPVADGLVQVGHAGVQDPFGFSCGSALSMDSVPVNQQPFVGIPFGPWPCNAVGSGSIRKSNNANFAPRVGFAWDIFGNGKTVLRGGYGLFYDQLPLSYYGRLGYNRPTGVGNGNPNSTYGMVLDSTGSGFCAGAGDVCGSGNSFLNPATAGPFAANVQAAMPFAVSAIDVKHTDTPRVHQFNATLQQQLGNHAAVEVGYIGSLGDRLPVVFNSNFGHEWSITSLVTDNFGVTPIFTMTNQGESTYQSLMARARVAGWHGLRLNATYTWSKAIDNASNARFPVLPVTGPNMLLGYQLVGTSNFNPDCIYFNSFCGIAPLTFPAINFAPSAVTTTGAGAVLTTPYTIPQDPFHFLTNDRGRSDFDSRHRLVLDYTWEIPGEKTSVLRGNWAVSGIFVAQSGQPFTIFAGPILGEITQRVSATGPVNVTSNPNGAIDPSNLVLASAACAPVFPFTVFLPAAGTPCLGNTGRNAFTGPNYINMNLALQKGFRVFGEGRMLTLRMEVYNLTNRANFYNPISTLSTDGSNLNPDFGKIKSAHDPRQMQFALRYSW
jgi:hypothetical protein